jgi:hypothetical protein
VTAKKESAEIARGTASVVIDSDKEAKPTVFLTPVTGGDDGDFSYNVTLPDGAKGALTLTGPEKRKIPLTEDVYSGTEENLPPGEYRLEGLIFKGAERVNFANEVVYLYSGMESTFTRNFSSVALVETTAAEFLASLSALPENDAEHPYTLDLSGFDVADLTEGSDPLGKIFAALNGKYVDLDLIGCDWTAIPNATYDIPNSRLNKDKIVSLTLPDALKTLGNYAFSSCSSLESIDLPDSLETLGSAAFSSCTSLKSIAIPKNITTIGGAAFSGCSSLESVDLPDGLTTIENEAFNGCRSLTSIDLPASLTSIARNAFRSADSLVFVISRAKTPPSAGNNFLSSTAKLDAIYVPDASVETYQTANEWKNFADNIKPLSEYEGE